MSDRPDVRIAGRRDEGLGGVSFLVGLAGVTFFLLHLISSLRDAEGMRALWACHIASLLAGTGILLRRAPLVGIGVLWLLAGIPLWCVYLAIGEPFHPTSLLTHFGGFAVGCHGLSLLGMPRGVWWKALAGLWVLLGIARLTSPPELNVNLAFHVYQRGVHFDGQYPASLLMLSLTSTGLFYIGEQQFRRMFPTDDSSWLRPTNQPD